MPTPRWRGTRAVKLKPGYPKLKITAAGALVTVAYSGPFSSLASLVPKLGGKLSALPRLTNILVDYRKLPIDEIDLAPGEAGPEGPGELIVTLRGTTPQTSLVAAEDERREEVEWVPIEKPLETCPLFLPADPGASPPRAAGAYALTDTDLDIIEEWKNKTTRTERNAVYSAGTTTANAKKFIDRLRRGQTSWTAYAPVHRRTLVQTTKPDSTACGKLISNVSTAAPEAPVGYIYVQSGDRAARQGRGGKWERIIELTGAESVDRDIYPDGAYPTLPAPP